MEIVGEFLGIDCDKNIWEYFKRHWSQFFPKIPSRSNFVRQSSNLHVNCIVRKYERLSFCTSIEEARELGAIKMEEVLDKQRLKHLHESGRAIPGVSCSTYIQVSMPKEATA